MNNLPKFLFVGTAKAGTTSIYHYLRQHPQISIPVKETFYFLKDIYLQNNLDWPAQRKSDDIILDTSQYTSLYRDSSDKLTGEIGTGYLYHWKESIPIILKTLGQNVKILIVLRHPTNRCFSSYMHFVKDLHDTGTFEKSLAKEFERQKMNWDFMWMHRDMGLYSAQVEAFKKNFENVKVLIYEDFITAPLPHMREIFTFLDLPDYQDLKADKAFNPSGIPKNIALQKFITHENPLKSVLRPVFRLIFSQENRERIRKETKGKNLTKGLQMSSETKVRLDQYFAADIKQLEKVLGYEISSWRRP